MAKTAKQNTSAPTGKSGDFTYIVIYVLSWITGIIFFIIGGNDKRKRLHSIQAILLGLIGWIIAWVFGIFLWGLGDLILLIVWLYGLYIGYQASEGTDMDIPVISDFAKKYT